MQLQQLRYVVAVAEEGSFTAAADRERVAQPSISAQIGLLERELGLPLFHRRRSGTEITAAGEAFLPWARQALADVESGRAEVRDLLGLRGGRLALGATPSLATAVLPAVLARFRERWPGVSVSLRQAGSRDLVSDLVGGSLDAALVILPVSPSVLEAEPLAHEELVLAVARSHVLATRTSITIDDLRDVPLVVPREGYDLREATLTACREAGFAPVLSVEGGEMDSVLALAAAGLGAAVVPSIVIDPEGPLVGIRFASTGVSPQSPMAGSGKPAPQRTIGLAVRADRPRTRATEAFAVELLGVLDQGWPGAPREGLRVLSR